MMRSLPEVADYRRLFVAGTPLLDVRAPIEFAAGAFPGATNLPLVDDNERHAIGIRYKQAGQLEAITLGERLVAGRAREERITAWAGFASQHPDAVLYCFRGGMRSKISQQWLYEERDILLPRVRGGYKALRRFLLEELDAAAAAMRPIVVGGRTGVGKTLLLRALANALDLEDLAWHRGSAFGRHATPQPTQIDFENRLSVALLRHRQSGATPLVVEDESRNIGSRNIPAGVFERFKAAPLVILEADLEQRVDNTLKEYVVDALAEHRGLYGPAAGFERWAAGLRESLDRIRRRLGGARHQLLRTVLTDALAVQRETGNIERHRAWIATLLSDYYDPMYDHQIAGNAPRIVFAGGREEVLAYLRHLSPTRTGGADLGTSSGALGAQSKPD